MRSDEDKLIFEEGLIGGLVLAAVGIATVSAIVPGGALRLVAGAYGWLSAESLPEMPWTLAIAAVALVVIVGIAAGAAGFWLLGWQVSEWHHQGLEYFSNPADGAKRMGKNERELMSEQQKKGEVAGVEIGGVELSRTREVAHISIGGLPGSGKTVVLNAMMMQILERGDRTILHDVKGDFTAWVFDPEAAVLLGPWDERAVWWDIARDVQTPEQATTFATQLFPDPTGSADPIFSRAARDLVAGAIQYRQATSPGGWSWDTLAFDLSQGAEHLIGLAQRANPMTKILVNPDSLATNRTAMSFMSQIATGVSWIPAYAAAFDFSRDANGELDKTRAFSIADWISGVDHEQVKTVILNNNMDYRERAAQIFGAMLATAAVRINSSSMPEVGADAPGLWVVLDEYPKLGKAAAIEVATIEELGRSRGIRVVKAIQDDSQLFAEMGRERGEASRSVQQTRLYCALATGTAAEVSQRLGERDVMRVSFPQAVGAGNKRADVVRAPALRADELTGLRVIKSTDWPGPGIELIAHSADCLVKLHQPFPAVPADHCPKIIESDRWRFGILNSMEMGAAIAGGPGLGAGIETISAAADEALDDDDLPMNLGTSDESDAEAADYF